MDQFKKDYDNMIKHTLAQKYNGKTNARLVLFSSIGHENLHNRNLPDGVENNKRIALYTKAMAEVAKANHIPFVDLYKPSLELYAKAAKPLTIDGVHLTHEGDRQIAAVIDAALFPGKPAPTLEAGSYAKLRKAVLDKDFDWFNRYRTVDGYSIYGGRADLRFAPDNQTNRVVVQREMAILDVMTANRDQRIWSVAQGGDLKVDDSDTPPFIPVKTNKPGPGPNGSYIFLNGDPGNKDHDGRQAHESQPLRVRAGVAGLGQSRADAMGYEGSALGGRLVKLSALEAQRRVERQDSHL